jgi:hypothetical protein
MNPKSIEHAESPDLALTMPALRRARKRAEEIAIATKTALVQVEKWSGRASASRPRAKAAYG